MAPSRTVVILNPHSAGGRTGRQWQQIERRLTDVVGPFTTHRTEAPGHAIQLANDAVLEGFERVLAVGGDGTVSETVNGLLESGRTSVTLGVVPRGTGSDFCRALGIPATLEGALEVLRRDRSARIDLGRIRYATANWSSGQRYFCNLVSFGLGGAVASRASRSSKALGGKAAFVVSTAVTLLGHHNQNVELIVDGCSLPAAKVLHVAVGNGPYHGGGMWVCPGADLFDGLLNVTVIGDISLGNIATRLPLLYNGRIYEHPQVRSLTTRSLSARSDETVLIEVDGEPIGRLPIEIEIVPAALQVIGDWGLAVSTTPIPILKPSIA